jgi:hypothetical protein
VSITESVLDVLRTTVDVDVVVEGVTSAAIHDVLPVVLCNTLVQINILIVSEERSIRRNL